jgi:hypothetical protein
MTVDRQVTRLHQGIIDGVIIPILNIHDGKDYYLFYSVNMSSSCNFVQLAVDPGNACRVW